MPSRILMLSPLASLALCPPPMNLFHHLGLMLTGTWKPRCSTRLSSRWQLSYQPSSAYRQTLLTKTPPTRTFLKLLSITVPIPGKNSCVVLMVYHMGVNISSILAMVAPQSQANVHQKTHFAVNSIVQALQAHTTIPYAIKPRSGILITRTTQTTQMT